MSNAPTKSHKPYHIRLPTHTHSLCPHAQPHHQNIASYCHTNRGPATHVQPLRPQPLPILKQQAHPISEHLTPPTPNPKTQHIESIDPHKPNPLGRLAAHPITQTLNIATSPQPNTSACSSKHTPPKTHTPHAHHPIKQRPTSESTQQPH